VVAAAVAIADNASHRDALLVTNDAVAELKDEGLRRCRLHLP
jgi:hypothetical protein